MKTISLFRSILILSIIFTYLNTIGSADVTCYHCHTKIVTEFRNNIHYKINFTCGNCHGGNTEFNGSYVSVNVMSGNFIGRPTRKEIAHICSKCHTKEEEDYKKSIHWEAIKSNHTDAATCTDCHGVHEIVPIDDPKSPMSRYNSPETCAKCHSNPKLMSTWYYGIKTDRMDTYKDSFHWKALSSGYGLVATCSDCHENHDIDSPESPNSSVYPDNLPKTCGQANCHPRAKFSKNIAMGLVHDAESLHTSKLVFNKSEISPKMKYYYLGPFDLAYWIGMFFKILTTGVIGTFTLMVLLDAFSRVKIERRW